MKPLGKISRTLFVSLLLATGNAFIAQFASADELRTGLTALPADEGCGSGYWKKHPASWPPTGYSVSQSVVSVFSAAAAFPAVANETLVQSLESARGSGILGSASILVRAAVTAVLNASDPDVDYPRTPASVVSDVNAALASNDRDTMLTLAIALNEDNKGEGGCPLE